MRLFVAASFLERPFLERLKCESSVSAAQMRQISSLDVVCLTGVPYQETHVSASGSSFKEVLLPSNSWVALVSDISAEVAKATAPGSE